MVSQKQQLVVVAGPTASGKNALARQLGREIVERNGQQVAFINADSRQIYKYLDIGTNKGALEDSGRSIFLLDRNYPVYKDSGIDMHLVSFLEPDQRFSAFDYQALVANLLAELGEQSVLPILVGGTGLYIQSVIDVERYSFSEVKTFDSLNESDRGNPRRLARLQRGEAKEVQPAATLSTLLNLEVDLHYIEAYIEELTERINSRVEEMLSAGLVDEVQKVLALGFPPTSVALQGIGYRQVLAYLGGELTEPECKQLIQIAHRQYAKRQITWFKKYLPKDKTAMFP